MYKNPSVKIDDPHLKNVSEPLKKEYVRVMEHLHPAFRWTLTEDVDDEWVEEIIPLLKKNMKIK